MSSPNSVRNAPLVTVVGFHHARGPEIESWYGVEEGIDPAIENNWSLLPFMALSDGAHMSTEDFSYFTLRRVATPSKPATSLFGISCTRQIDANELKVRPPDVTRSTVQKAVVVIAESPQFFGQLREKLRIVTQAWFSQGDFSDTQILKDFQESLAKSMEYVDENKDEFLGLGLREFIHEWKHQTLVLFKCCLLQPKMLFFGSKCEKVCMMQFSLISLIPGLLRALEDCADPSLADYEKRMVMPTSLRSSDRSSLLAYMGIPLQLFGKGSFFGPYTPLQQLDLLADHGTKSYMVGSTNSLLLQQRDRYSDILINLDEHTITILSPSLRSALSLSSADRRWIDSLVSTVSDTWDPSNPSRPRSLGYTGSEEYIRLKFEEYLLSLLSTIKYHLYLQSNTPSFHAQQKDPPSPAPDFSLQFIHAFMTTHTFDLFSNHTSPHLFDLVPPRHPTSGSLGLDDISRRLGQQLESLHFDERVREGREALGSRFAAGRSKVSSTLQSLWADIETAREAQRKRAAEQQKEKAESTSSMSAEAPRSSEETTLTVATSTSSEKQERQEKQEEATPLSPIQTTAAKAGSYVSSWGSWAAERLRNSNTGNTSGSVSTTPSEVKSKHSSEVKGKERDGSEAGSVRSKARDSSGSWSGMMARLRGSGRESIGSLKELVERVKQDDKDKDKDKTEPVIDKEEA